MCRYTTIFPITTQHLLNTSQSNNLTAEMMYERNRRYHLYNNNIDSSIARLNLQSIMRKTSQFFSIFSSLIFVLFTCYFLFGIEI